MTMKALQFEPISDERFFERFPSASEMAGAIASCKGSIETSRQGMAHRQKMYYDCVDDYSMGGICDKAAEENISRMRSAIRAMEEQMESGAQRHVSRRQVLCDLEGNIVTQRIVSSRFGGCWIYFPYNDEEPEFVGLAKRAATYEGKGFRVMTIETEVEYYFEPKMTKRGLFIQSRIVRRELTEATEEELRFSVTEADDVEFFAANA